jgi:hypothetical protein
LTPEDLAVLRAYLAAMHGFQACVAGAVTAFEEKRYEPKLAIRAGDLLLILRERRQPAFNAGLRAGYGPEAMTELLEHCYSACARAHIQLHPHGSVPESVQVNFESAIGRPLAALSDLIGSGEAGVELPAARGKTQRSRSGPRPKNDALLDFVERELRKNAQLTDKEILDKFRKKHPKHPIFESNDPCAALRAARARRKRRRPKA